ASMGGQVTGRRAGTLANEGFTGAIILDDPLKPEDAFSQTARRKANRKILNTVNSRKAKSDTPIILIMQRLHVEDPTNFVMTGNVPGKWEQIS
ncbi:helicase, partial [Acinetobacter baumannii]|nr:helicase [Acinetobacter baumannii]